MTGTTVVDGRAAAGGHPAGARAVTEGWRPTETLVRALAAGAGCAVVAVAFGRPDLWVLGAPLLVAGVLALVRRPPLDAHPLRPVADLASRSLREGQRTSVTVRLGGLHGAEQVTRTVDRAPFVTVARQSRASTHLCDPDADTHDLVVDLTAERWGHREVGAGQAAATSPWAGWRWGPQPVPGRSLTVLPVCAPASPPVPRRRTRSAWSARTSRAAPATAASSPASGRSRSATGCAGSTGGCRWPPASCTSCRPAPRRTPPCCCWSTRSWTSAPVAAWTAPPAAST